MDSNLSHISPALHSLSVPLLSLTPDPANVRLHPDRNLDAIKASLTRFGQQRPILVDSRGIIVAGNGTFEAAKAMGWEHIAAVRTDLSGTDAVAFAIADNRTGLLAEWDQDALTRQLEAILGEDATLAHATGFTPDEIAAAIAELHGVPNLPPGAEGQEFDEGAANNVAMVECPECGHKFPQ